MDYTLSDEISTDFVSMVTTDLIMNIQAKILKHLKRLELISLNKFVITIFSR
jgi:hypothetical protein